MFGDSELGALIVSFVALGIFIGWGSYYVGRRRGFQEGYGTACRVRDRSRSDRFEEWMSEQEKVKSCLPNSPSSGS